ncbi:MAG: 4Fe-4S dicluster domain-containing protein [Nocardioides sp.]
MTSTIDTDGGAAAETHSAYFKNVDPAGFPEVSHEEKARLFDEVKADIRFHDYLYGCYECGICVAVCPSAKFYDFSPRRIAQAAAREDVELVYQQMQEDIWECSQCFRACAARAGTTPAASSPSCARSR